MSMGELKQGLVQAATELDEAYAQTPPLADEEWGGIINEAATHLAAYRALMNRLREETFSAGRATGRRAETIEEVHLRVADMLGGSSRPETEGVVGNSAQPSHFTEVELRHYARLRDEFRVGRNVGEGEEKRLERISNTLGHIASNYQQGRSAAQLFRDNSEGLPL